MFYTILSYLSPFGLWTFCKVDKTLKGSFEGWGSPEGGGYEEQSCSFRRDTSIPPPTKIKFLVFENFEIFQSHSKMKKCLDDVQKRIRHVGPTLRI